MTRKIGYILAAAALLLTLAACRSQYEEPTEPDVPTLPSFSLEQTPAQKLADAIGKTGTEESYDIRWGIRTTLGTDSREDADTQTVSAQCPPDWDEICAKVPDLSLWDAFLEGFCNRSLLIIPSNTGNLRYELQELSWEDAQVLLYGQERTAPLADARWTIALTVDAAGRLSGFELTGERETESRTVFLTLSFPDSP